MTKHQLILGAGPVGCYLAYKLLVENPDLHIVMFETRKFERAQVIRIPFDIANDLPPMIKNEMWPEHETRSRIFNSGRADDSNFWPRPSYYYWPFISIHALQTAMITLLKNDREFKDRFYFVDYDGEFNFENWERSLSTTYPQFKDSLKDKVEAIYCTCGIAAKSMRATLNLQQGKQPQDKGHGIYLIYQNKKSEQYAHQISYQTFAELGVTYAASNNRDLDVQLYTYPTGSLAEIFQTMPDDFIKAAAYAKDGNDMEKLLQSLSPTSQQWLMQYQQALWQIAQELAIDLPQNLSDIQIFYAPRMEYYWDIIATVAKFNHHSYATFFLGDSAGSTDYKSGLSMGRGLLSAKYLSRIIARDANNLDSAVMAFQTYWQTIVEREFNQDAAGSDPWINYHYLMKGRHVVFSDGTEVHYQDDGQFEDYVRDLYR